MAAVSVAGPGPLSEMFSITVRFINAQRVFISYTLINTSNTKIIRIAVNNIDNVSRIKILIWDI